MKKKNYLLILLLFLLSYCANAEILIYGQLSNAQNTEFANVKTDVRYAALPSEKLEFKLADITSDGKYSISLPDSITKIHISFLGVACKSASFILYTYPNTKYEINVALPPNYVRYVTDSAYIIGDFNNFSEDEGYIPMKKVGKHHYSLTLDRKDTLKYQILLLEENPYFGILTKTFSIPGADSYEVATNSKKMNDHISYAIPKNEKIVIDVDLSKLFVDSITYVNSEAQFSSNSSTILEIINCKNALKEPINQYWKALNIIFDSTNSSEEDIRSCNYTLCQVISKLFIQVKSEEAKMYVAMKYVEHACYGVFLSKAQIDTNITSFLTSRVLKHPKDQTYISDYDLYLILFLESKGKEIPYFENPNFMALIVPDNNRIGLIQNSIDMAMEKKDTIQAKIYYSYLKNNFPDAKNALEELKKHNLDGNTPKQIVVGNTIPDFTMPDLNDTTKTFSIRDLRGKYILIDLWGTWCGWCIKEFPALHDTYKKYKDKNFNILSIALDSPAKVKQFCSAPNFPMPWLHSYEVARIDGPIYKILEASGVPHPILISPDGTILEIGSNLRGINLDNTLEKYLK